MTESVRPPPTVPARDERGSGSVGHSPTLGRRPPTRGERGSGTLLTAATLVVATVVAAFAVLVGMLAGAVGHVRGAADLAAVSAAAAQREGRSPCAAARVVAEENQTSLRDCDTEGDLFDFAVSVTVAAPLELDVPGVPEEVVAISHAGWLTD